MNNTIVYKKHKSRKLTRDEYDTFHNYNIECNSLSRERE